LKLFIKSDYVRVQHGKLQHVHDKRIKHIIPLKGRSSASVSLRLGNDGALDFKTILQENPKLIDKHALAVQGYVGFKAKQGESSEQTIKRLINHLTDNLSWLYDQIPEAERKQTRQWYDGANKIANDWAKKYKLPVPQVAGVIACMSPQLEWYQNLHLAQHIIETYQGKDKLKWADGMAEQIEPKVLAELKGKALSEVEDEGLRAIWVLAYNKSQDKSSVDIYSPEGEKVGQQGQTYWFTSAAIIAKAWNILEGRPITNNLSKAHKVRNFYNNIIDPSDAESVTIDTHAIAAAYLAPLAGNDIEVLHNFGAAAGKGEVSPGTAAGVLGTYYIAADAYRKAAQKVGLLPRELQSIIWDFIKNKFDKGLKISSASSKELKNAWSEYTAGKRSLESVRAEVSKRWNQSDSKAYGRSKASDDKGKLHKSLFWIEREGERPGSGVLSRTTRFTLAKSDYIRVRLGRLEHVHDRRIRKEKPQSFYNGLTKISGPLGSNPGGIYQDNNGTKYYVKIPANQDTAINEVVANKLYELAGVKVPELDLIDANGKLGVAGKWMQMDAERVTPDKEGVYSGFVTDAWLANWDVVGMSYDNLMLADGQAVRVDTGGALLYRARGERKGAAFGPAVTELQTLRDPSLNETSASVFAGIPLSAIRSSAENVLNIPKKAIVDTVNTYGSKWDDITKQHVIDTLLARQAYIHNLFTTFVLKSEYYRVRNGKLEYVHDGRTKHQVFHYSKNHNLVRLDPTYYGTGMAGGETKRKKTDPENWVDRTYFYVGEHHTKEDGLGQHKYISEFDPKEIYDFASDPDSLQSTSIDFGKFSVTKYEKKIKEAGYKGFIVHHPQLGSVIAAFYPQSVDKLSKAGYIAVDLNNSKFTVSKSDYVRIRNGKLEHVHDKRVKKDKRLDRAVASLHKSMDEIKHLVDHEECRVIAPDGKVIFKKGGSKSQISFVEEEMALFKGCSFIHNHPSGSSFSLEDINFAIKTGMKEIYAVHDGLVYKMHIPQGISDLYAWWDTKGILLYWQLDTELKKDFTAQIQSGKLAIEDANKLHHHVLWNRFTHEVKYAFKVDSFVYSKETR